MSFSQDIQAQPKAPSPDPAHFRKVLGHVPTSVSIATGHDAQGPFGIVLGSLVSISLAPALVGLFIDNGSQSLQRLLACQNLCINILKAEDGAFCKSFAREKETRFQCGNWDIAGGQPPRYAHALAWLTGPIERSLIIGDHHLIVISTEDLTLHTLADQTDPLIFFRGAFRA